VPGFGLRVRAGGSRTWQFRYKIGDNSGGSASAAILPYQARAIAANHHAAVRLGRDPAGEKEEGRATASETVGAAAHRFLAFKKEKLKPRSYVEIERHLLVNSASLHPLQLRKIARHSIATLLTALSAGHTPRVADAVRASLQTFFNWAIGQGLVDGNPVVGTNTAHDAVARDRVLTDDELRQIWLACEDDHYGAIVKLLMLTGQRREEIGGLCRSEIDERGFLLPLARTKNQRPHFVPLSDTARAIIEEQPSRSRDFLFGFGESSFSGWSAAKKRLDARIEYLDGKTPAEWRLHDLRRTAATGMADLGVQPHVIEAILNHVSGHKAGVAGVYNRSTYEPEKRAALDLWTDHVIAVIKAGTSNNVR
jgi:integrase